MYKSLVVAVLTASILTAGTAQSNAVYEGVEAKGSPYVLTLLTSKTSRSSFCSMALLTERIVVTAAHCVIADQGKAPELRWDIRDIYVSQPGANVVTDDLSTRVRVAKVITVPDFVNTWKPELNDRRTQIDDIAFLFLDSPLVNGYSVEIATKEDIEFAFANNLKVTHFGYGLQNPNSQNHSPWSTQLPQTTNYDQHLDPSKVMYTQEGPSALCPGDSGGPWYFDINGVKKIAAVTVAASGCRGSKPYQGKVLGTRIYPYLTLMNEKWNEFLATEKKLKEEAVAKAKEQERLITESKLSGKFLVPGGCHVPTINAELHFLQKDGSWALAAPALGWLSSSETCPKTHSGMPWTSVPFSENVQLKWRFWAPGFDIFGEQFTWIAPVKDSPAAPSEPAPSKEIESKKSFKVKCKKGNSVKIFNRSLKNCPTGWSLKK